MSMETNSYVTLFDEDATIYDTLTLKMFSCKPFSNVLKNRRNIIS